LTTVFSDDGSQQHILGYYVDENGELVPSRHDAGRFDLDAAATVLIALGNDYDGHEGELIFADENEELPEA